MKKIASLAVILFLAAGASARVEAALSTLLLDLRPVNVSADRASSVRSLVRKQLDRLQNCDLVSDKKIAAALDKNGQKPACSDRVCALQCAKSLKADRAIYGSIQVMKKAYDRKMGTEGANKYLLAKDEVQQIVTTLFLVDAKKDAVLTIITDAAPVNFGDRDAERIVFKLRSYFVTEIDAKKNKGRESSPAFKPGVFLYAAPSGFIPLGSFRNMSRGGAGVTFGVDMTGLAVKNSRLGFQGGYYYIFPNQKKIEYHHAIPLLVRAGYQFNLPKNFSMTPLLGAGFIIHLISQDISQVRIPGVYRYSLRPYYDPQIMVKCEVSYSIGRWSILLAPSFTAFFEKKSTGMFVGADLGFGCSF